MPSVRKIVRKKLGFTKGGIGCCGNLWRSCRLDHEIDRAPTGNFAGEQIGGSLAPPEEQDRRMQSVEWSSDLEMNSVRKIVRKKLGFKKGNPGCCGNLWRSCRSDREIDRAPSGNFAGEQIGGSLAPPEASSEIDLATALARDRRMQSVEWSSDLEIDRPSLKRFLKGEEEEREQQVPGLGENCCVCMERKKGSAIIPCGHAFCRVCARELWIERRSCALCNQTILEVLDLF